MLEAVKEKLLSVENELEIVKEQLSERDQELAASHELLKYRQLELSEQKKIEDELRRNLADLNNNEQESTASHELLKAYQQELADQKKIEDELRRNLADLNKTEHELIVSYELLKVQYQELVDQKKMEDETRKNLTDSKKDEQELARLKAELEMTKKAKSEFLSLLSREIRAPLNIILGYSDILHSTNLDENQKNYLNSVLFSGNTLLAVMHDVMELSRLETSNLIFESIDFDLENLVYDVFKAAKIKMKDQEVNFGLDWDEQLSNWWKGDPSSLRKILMNVLTSVVDLADQGDIGLTVSSEGISQGKETIKFCVKYNGFGAAQAQINQLFQSFTQTDSETLVYASRVGLALAVSKKFVDALEGKIWIESIEGKGILLFITIPFMPGTSLIQQPIEPLEREKLVGKTVFYVDDHQPSLETLSRYCEKMGFKVVVFSSEQEALQKLEEGIGLGALPDVVLINIALPISGNFLAKEIHANSNFDKIKIVAIASDPRSGICRLSEEEGFNAFLAKPVSYTDLLKVLCSLLGDSRGESSRIITRYVADEVSLKGFRVLVVDDSMACRKLMKWYLDKWGCVSDFANEGQEAIDKIKANSYHVCLMDLNMPDGMDGVEATKIIRAELNQDLPIIACTVSEMKSDVERALDAGMEEFLSKPINENRLKEVLIKYVYFAKNDSLSG